MTRPRYGSGSASPRPSAQRRWTRRELLCGMGAAGALGALGALGPLAAVSRALRLARAAGDGAGYPAPPIPGACVAPQSATQETLVALLQAVVPGPELDPDGAPGAVEACALNLMVDGFYPFREAAPLIVGLLDELSRRGHGGATFVELQPAQREEILAQAQEQLGLIRLAYRAIRSAFYGGAYNGVGLAYLGYPGPNLGYRHMEPCSFRAPVCTERTSEGWMP